MLGERSWYFSLVRRSSLERSGYCSFGLKSNFRRVSKQSYPKYHPIILKYGIKQGISPFSQHPYFQELPNMSQTTATLAISPVPSLQIKTSPFIEYKLYCDLTCVRQCIEGTIEVTQTGKHGRK
jgi:hypothetical protein